VKGVVDRRDAVGDDAAADEEHRRRSRDGEPAHHPRGCGEDATADGRKERLPSGCQQSAGVVELHDRGHEAVDADRHRRGNGEQHGQLGEEWPACHHAERDHDDLSRENEIGADRAGDLLRLERG
jgi:hypothetical protein